MLPKKEKGNPTLIDKRLLIELLDAITDSQDDDGQMWDALLKRCLCASRSELEEFLDELSQSPGTYIPTLRTFTFHICNKYSRTTPSLSRCNTTLPNFASLLITIVIMKNLQHSDTFGFGEFLHNCVKLLWQSYNNKSISLTGNKEASQMIKKVFSAILDANGVLGVLVSEASGHRCLKRILFELNMISQIDQEKLLQAVDVVATLVEKCPEHKEISSQTSGFPIYKACTALLETLRQHKSAERALLVSGKNSLPPMLCEMDELSSKESGTQYRNKKKADNNSVPLSPDDPHLTLLEMVVPRKQSDLPNFLQALEQRKVDSLRDLIGLLPCASCHKQALMRFSPDKYSSLMEEEVSTNIGPPERLFRLPFEFDDDDRLGPWDILLSEDTIKEMRQLGSPHLTKSVMKKLGQISSGAWDRHELRRTVFLSHVIPVYEELFDDDLRILWQIDCGFSVRSYSFMQHVKVWTVTSDQEQIRRTLDNLSMVHQVYTAKHNGQCMVKLISNDNIILPMQFGGEDETKSAENRLYNSQMDDERLIEVHKMLITNKFIPLSTSLFKSLIMGGSDFTFQVSKIEYEIINNPTSAIVIGRSGTGKTTCIVFRQIASYLANRLCKTPSSQNSSCRRQIFITVSHNLCYRVKKYFNGLQESATLAGKKISKTQFNEYVRRKEEEVSSINMADSMIIKEKDKERELGNIPNSFRQLTDHDFPLFITYDKFSKMLQGTYNVDIQKLITQQKLNVDNDDTYDDGDEGEVVNINNASWMHYVDYDLFKKKYWPRFGDQYRQKLDCELVYAEFSIIKGSNPEGDYLSRDDYRTISFKKFPAFCHNRDQIYDLFERYEKLKARNGDYDSIDRTIAILNCAKTKALGGPPIHEVYIDECQDNQIVDFSLILNVFNCAESIFLAGDIAQCIARGSSFRFQDIRSLMYQWELTRIQANRNRRATIKPKQFELNINYRSHNGILKLASSVIDLIWHFFPDSIDKLSREIGEIGGPRPIVFDGFQAETFYFNVFSIGENATDCIEFGAEQVIIVRDEVAKRQVKDRIGNMGLVMTIFEAKGMEFSDVLLYNFFTDSPAHLKWRVILSALDDNSKGVQNFSHEKHYILSSELKHLYVAVTRARQHIWIFDESTEWSEPIRVYWEHHGLVKVIRNVDEISTLPTLAKKSSSHEWNQRGIMFFERQQFDQAIFCFEKSGNEENYNLANAHYLQQIARDSVHNSNNATIKSNIKNAAQAFKKCLLPTQAASCYQDFGMHKEAGDVYAEFDMHESAAHCYNKAKMWHEAGKYFERAGKYTDAVVAYKNDGSYEIVIDLMQRYRQEIEEKIFHRITRLVNIHYRRENNKEMSEKALSILSTQEEQFELLREHAPEELHKIWEKNNQFRAAAEDLYARGKFREAADMFIRSVDKDEDIIEGLKCLLHLCSVDIMKTIMLDMNSSTLRELCNQASDIITKIKSQQKSLLEEELQLYLAYLNKDLNRIQKCIQFFKSCEDLVAEFRAVSIWLQIYPQPSDIQAEYWQERLQYLLRLCEISFSFIAPRQDVNIKEIHKYFEDFFFVKEVKNRPQERQILFGNPLLYFMEGKDGAKNVSEIIDDWHIYNVNIVHLSISQFLASYIYKLIFKAGQDGKNIPEIAFKICYKCQKLNCRNLHVTPSPLILRQRLTFSCLQYTVMRQLGVLYHRRLLIDEQSKEVLGLQRSWAERLIKIHFRYQSPQISCPEVTYMVLNELPRLTYNGFIDLSYKKWLGDEFNIKDFASMLKCIFVFQQLQNIWGINKFHWEVSKINSYNNSIGFEFNYDCGVYEAVGKRLSSFILSLNSDLVIPAIGKAKGFISYAVKHAEHVNLISANSFGDLTSLMEFMTSLIFAAHPGCCDFCLPRGYLVNYYSSFNINPLFQSNYNRYNNHLYSSELKNSFNQIRQLLAKLFSTDQFYQTVILRLIRLLILFAINDSTLEYMVLDYFKNLNNDQRYNQFYSSKLKKYLGVSYLRLLINILNEDLKETGCDSLVIVYHYRRGMSRFTYLEKSGITKLSYDSIDGFHSSLQKITSSEVTEERSETSSILTNQLLSQEVDDSEQNAVPIPVGFNNDVDDNDEDDKQFTGSEEAQEPATEVQAWFRKIHDSPQAHEAARKIQTWFRRAHDRKSCQQHVHDQTLDKVYHDMLDFCQNISQCNVQKEKEVVREYNIILKGQTVDITVKLIKLQSKMDVIQNKLKKSINRFSDDNKIEICLELEDELRYNHYEKVKSMLESLSIENADTKHKKVDIGWLKNELKQANDIIEQVSEWMDRCKAAMKVGYSEFI